MKKIDGKELKEKSKTKAKLALEDYKAFALKGNVLDLAIGVVLGSAFTNIVNTLVSALLTPIISLLTSNVDLSTLFITLKGGTFETLEQAKAAGEIINSVLNFVIVSIVLFILVKALTKANKKEKIENEVTTKECPYCLSTIPLHASRCPHCTSVLEKEETVSE